MRSLTEKQIKTHMSEVQNLSKEEEDGKKTLVAIV